MKKGFWYIVWKGSVKDTRCLWGRIESGFCNATSRESLIFRPICLRGSESSRLFGRQWWWSCITPAIRELQVTLAFRRPEKVQDRAYHQPSLALSLSRVSFPTLRTCRGICHGPGYHNSPRMRFWLGPDPRSGKSNVPENKVQLYILCIAFAQVNCTYLPTCSDKPVMTALHRAWSSNLFAPYLFDTIAKEYNVPIYLLSGKSRVSTFSRGLTGRGYQLQVSKFRLSDRLNFFFFVLCSPKYYWDFILEAASSSLPASPFSRFSDPKDPYSVREYKLEQSPRYKRLTIITPLKPF